ncbi:hypothetical protein [Arachidicoccus terrestris]|uniref:hypothetical protein n=1 Tax=Arachidicoccus terrestris TaxID=2875539 RepID=UPI001CC3DFAD|nr:hypothetical protein [Arachidicoccus terrestris]UAY56239.1 hypothetical protein K9M52_04265 [Arachidicoccus terrestris]
MKQKIDGVENRKILKFIVERPFHTKPVLKRAFKQDGVKYYETVDGKIYDAEKYDKVFGKGKKGVIKHSRYKGENPNANTAAMQ